MKSPHQEDLFSILQATPTQEPILQEQKKGLSPITKVTLEPELENSPSLAPATNDIPKTPKIYTVSEISLELRDKLKETFGLITIEGEVADFKGIHRSGHLYFALKDEKSQIRAVMWKGALQKVPFEVKGGISVVVQGRLDYYPGGGSLQLVVEKMEPVGLGALQLKLEQLKEKLKSEGLFDSFRKRPVRPLNWRIGIVTSKTTAALQDILRVYRSRFPLTEIFVFHASVQGEKAPAEISAALDRANRFSAAQNKPLDVLILTRGGGSYEDLFCFNDEVVCRALAKSKVPTVSAVGHEIDTTLSDFVADKRSATPSHAASETVPEASLWIQRLKDLEEIFQRRMGQKISDSRQLLDSYSNRLLLAAPERRIQNQKTLLTEKQKRLESLMNFSLEKRRSQLARLSSLLDALSPLKVLDRGYSVTTETTSGKVLRSFAEVAPGSAISVRLAKGRINASVTQAIDSP